MCVISVAVWTLRLNVATQPFFPLLLTGWHTCWGGKLSDWLVSACRCSAGWLAPANNLSHTRMWTQTCDVLPPDGVVWTTSRSRHDLWKKRVLLSLADTGLLCFSHTGMEILQLPVCPARSGLLPFTATGKWASLSGPSRLGKASSLPIQ